MHQSQPTGVVGPVLTGITSLALFFYVLLASSITLGGPLVQPAQDRVASSSEQVDPRSAPNLRGTMLGLLKPRLGQGDRIAALRAFQVALTQVGDGTNYVWYRSTSRLSGVIRPVRSFADADGRICRELRVTLHAGRYYSRSMDGTACRGADGQWSLGE